MTQIDDLRLRETYEKINSINVQIFGLAPISEEKFFRIPKLGGTAAKRMVADRRKLAQLESENARLRQKVSQLEDALRRKVATFATPEDSGAGVDHGP